MTIGTKIQQNDIQQTDIDQNDIQQANFRQNDIQQKKLCRMAFHS